MTTNVPEGTTQFDPVGKVILFHVVGGATVVALVDSVDEEEGIYRLTKPAELMVMPTREGLKRDFQPWLSQFGTLPPINVMDLDCIHILLPRQAPADVEASYREFTGMVQVPPEKKLIIPGV